MIRYLLLCLPLLMGCGNAAAPDASGSSRDRSAATIVLVRHAEKEAGEDPGLTPEGQQRALRLAERYADERLSAVYTTDTRRTRATAAPTAAAHELQVAVYDPADVASLAKRLLQTPAGQTVLVVGHSNTIPSLVNALVPGAGLAAIDESDFSNLFVVRVAAKGSARLQQRTY